MRKSNLATVLGVKMEKLFKLLVSNNFEISFQVTKLLLRYYARNGPASSAEKLVSYCEQKGYELTSECYSLLIESYGNQKTPGLALDLIKTMEEDEMFQNIDMSKMACSAMRVL